LLSNDDHGGHVHVDLDTLATALYVKIDDELRASPQLNRWRPKVGIAPKITDAELITVSVMQALLGYHDESRWIRYARKALHHLFPHLPKQPGYNKLSRPGFVGDSQPCEGRSHASTEQVPGRGP
jgi:hypothetical protein